MTNDDFVFLLSQSVLIPLAISLINFKRLDRLYYPFIILLLIDFLNELLSYILINHFNLSNTAVNNVYSLLECCVILYQLYLWRNTRKPDYKYTFLISFCIVIWIIEDVLFSKIKTVSPYFNITYAFVIVMLSINKINATIVSSKESLIRNPQIILCVTFITYFIYQIIFEASEFISNTSTITLRLYIGFAYINLVRNILFAIAMYILTSKKSNYDEYFKNR